MISIHYSKGNLLVQNWKEKLKDLVVAHEFVEDASLEAPTLQDKNLSFSGEKEIQKFIDDLEKEINDWRTPRCGV